jgi:hypothetical protein
MEHAIQVQLVTLGDEVRSAAIPNASKRTTLWCVDKLPALYAKFRLTCESRYGEEIARLLQAALSELVSSETASPATQELAASITERLRLLHEQSGIPGLDLKPPRPAPPRSRKTDKGCRKVGRKSGDYGPKSGIASLGPCRVSSCFAS